MRTFAIAVIVSVIAWSSATAQSQIEVKDPEVLQLAVKDQSRDPREPTVISGFAWLVSVQADDGSWSFADKDKFANAGSDRSRIKATALAVLAMCGAGHTHKEGAYRHSIERGVKYLLAKQQDNGDWRDEHGDVTAHALATIAVCELHAMANDKSLAGPCQKGIKWLQKLQQKDGGWGSNRGDDSHLEATVWCLMALKSGHMAYLTVDPQTVKSVHGFLASLRVKDHPQYGFKSRKAEPLATAMGLVMALHLGQKEIREPGVEELVRAKASLVDAEFRYFAMHTIKDLRNEQATAWQMSVKNSLVESQSKKDRERGSWFDTKDRSSATGGRLYQTALHLMVLQMRPNKFLIERQPLEDDFPL